MKQRHLNRNKVLSGCVGKKAYASFTEAAAIAKRQKNRRNKKDVHPYHCRACNLVHLGEGLDALTEKHRTKRREPKRRDRSIEKDYETPF